MHEHLFACSCKCTNRICCSCNGAAHTSRWSAFLERGCAIHPPTTPPTCVSQKSPGTASSPLLSTVPHPCLTVRNTEDCWPRLRPGQGKLQNVREGANRRVIVAEKPAILFVDAHASRRAIIFGLFVCFHCDPSPIGERVLSD